MTPKEIYNYLNDQILTAKAHGLVLIHGSFGHAEANSCCALSTVPGFDLNRGDFGIEDELGITAEEIWRIIRGFDSSTAPCITDPYMELGQKLRVTHNPISYWDYTPNA